MEIGKELLRQGTPRCLLVPIEKSAGAVVRDAIEERIRGSVIENAGRSDVLELQDRSTSAAGGRRKVADGVFEQIARGAEPRKCTIGTDGGTELVQFPSTELCERMAVCRVERMAVPLCADDEPQVGELF